MPRNHDVDSRMISSLLWDANTSEIGKSCQKFKPGPQTSPAHDRSSMKKRRPVRIKGELNTESDGLSERFNGRARGSCAELTPVIRKSSSYSSVRSIVV